ncbi:MAG: major facilitator superfamily 1 [Cypionkella sp.]|uniref:MFS transporter n=1 Tax=Cypionkella sp. TaxID=2811411 RepID=UPI002614803D|nr:MFS transporter [Cypionkella sp.]MDB5659894.1 major facilitator superfamily 1 [Cypionkella sp.]
MKIDTPYTARHYAGFAIVLIGLMLMMASASAPSPFYPVLQRDIGFSDPVLTGIFAVYTVFLLATLLTAGSCSDHLGRRPVLSAGFAGLALSLLVFEQATTVEGLLMARAIQGISCALLLSTLSATIVDLEPPSHTGIAAIANSVIPLVGLALGALVAGFIMGVAQAPKFDIFGTLIVLSLVLSVATWALPETSPRHEGLLKALRPRLGLPPRARDAFWQAAPAIIAGWATGGLYLSLGAPIVSRIFGIHSTLMQAFVVTLLSGMGALACFLARHRSPRQITLGGTAALSIGTALTLIGMALPSLPLYLVALAVAGKGFGTCFYGALRTLIPLSAPNERAELFASILTLSYMAFGAPTLIAGLLLPHLGLTVTAVGYGVLIVLLSATAGLLRKYTATN